MRKERKEEETAEVVVVITPSADKEEVTFRVTLRRHQLRDVLERDAYGEEVFEAFRDVVCDALGYDIEECVVNVFLPEHPDDSVWEGPHGPRPEVWMKTGDVIDGKLLLH